MARDQIPPCRLEVGLEPTLQAPAQARNGVRDAFSGRLSVTAVERLLTVVSELVTNSVKHGPGKPIKLTLATDVDGLITGEVEDQGSGQVAIRELTDESTGGMGLRVIRGLTDRWGVYEGSTHVWFEIQT